MHYLNGQEQPEGWPEIAQDTLLRPVCEMAPNHVQDDSLSFGGSISCLVSQQLIQPDTVVQPMGCCSEPLLFLFTSANIGTPAI